MRKLALVVAAAAVLTPNLASAAEKEIYGTYKLISITQRFETGEVATLPRDQGFINYGRDGRMMVIIVGDGRPKPESVEKMTDQERVALYRSLVAYAGTYKFDGKTMEHYVDISWNEMCGQERGNSEMSR